MRKVYLGNLGGRIPGFITKLEVGSELRHFTDEELTQLEDFFENEGQPQVSINKTTNVATITFTPLPSNLISIAKNSLNLDFNIAIMTTKHPGSSSITWKRYYRKGITDGTYGGGNFRLTHPKSPINSVQTTSVFDLADSETRKVNPQMTLTEDHLRRGEIVINLNELKNPKNVTGDDTFRLWYTSPTAGRYNIVRDEIKTDSSRTPWAWYLFLGMYLNKNTKGVGTTVDYLYVNYDYVNET